MPPVTVNVVKSHDYLQYSERQRGRRRRGPQPGPSGTRSAYSSTARAISFSGVHRRPALWPRRGCHCMPATGWNRNQTRHRGVKVRNTVDGLERYSANERGFSRGVEYHEHVRIEYYKFSFFSSRQGSYVWLEFTGIMLYGQDPGLFMLCLSARESSLLYSLD